MSTPLTKPAEARINPIVFYGSTSLILLLTATLVSFPDAAGIWLGQVQTWLSQSFFWYYMLAIGAYLFFVCWIAFSRFGQLKLGADHEKPDFSYAAWAGMLFHPGLVFHYSISQRLNRLTICIIHQKAWQVPRKPHGKLYS